MNIKELLGKVSKVNAAIKKHNEEHKQTKWELERRKQELDTEIVKYNEQFGTELTLDNLDTIKDEYTNVVTSVTENMVTMEKALALQEEGKVDAIRKLLGVDGKVETLSKIELDMSDLVSVEEIEKTVQARLETFDETNEIDERDALVKGKKESTKRTKQKIEKELESIESNTVDDLPSLEDVSEVNSDEFVAEEVAETNVSLEDLSDLDELDSFELPELLAGKVEKKETVSTKSKKVSEEKPKPITDVSLASLDDISGLDELGSIGGLDGKKYKKLDEGIVDLGFDDALIQDITALV